MSVESAPAPHPQPGRSRLLMMGGLAVALGGSIWTTIQGTSCAACAAATGMLGDLPLGPAGIAFYGLMLLLAWRFHARTAYTVLLFFAGGVHLALIGILLARQLLCAPCLVTAAGALTAASVPLARDPDAYPRAAVTLLAALVIVNGGMILLAGRRQATVMAAARQEASALLTQPVAPDTVRLVAYYMPGCAACEEVEKRILPPLIAKHPGKVVLDVRPPRKGLPYPMIVVLGRDGALFPGKPTIESLDRAVLRALHGPASAPPPSGALSLGPSPLR